MFAIRLPGISLQIRSISASDCGSLDKNDVRPLLSEGATACNRLVEAQWATGVGPCHDENVGACLSRVYGCPDSRLRDVTRDHVDAPGMTATLRSHLVLDHRAGKPRLGEAAHGALDIHGVAVAGIGVADDGNRYCVADISALVEDLCIGDQTGIRKAQPTGRNSKAAHEGQSKTRALDQSRRQRVEAAGHDQQFTGGEKLAKQGGGTRHGTSSGTGFVGETASEPLEVTPKAAVDNRQPSPHIELR